MQLLKTFQISEDKKYSQKTTREASRGVIFDKKGMIPLLRVWRDQHHKLPWGGLEWNEDPKVAFEREVLEECGCTIENIHVIWKVVQQNSTWQQTSYYYYAEIIWKALPHFTDKEISLGFELRRYPLEEALSILQKDIPSYERGKYILERDLFILNKILAKIR